MRLTVCALYGAATLGLVLAGPFAGAAPISVRPLHHSGQPVTNSAVSEQSITISAGDTSSMVAFTLKADTGTH